jgi:hypothetical protein
MGMTSTPSSDPDKAFPALRLFVAAAACALAAVGVSAALANAHATGSTAPAPCVKRSPGTVPANPWAAARNELAPENPTAIRRCRYSGLKAHPRLTLERSVTPRSPTARTA